MVTSTIETISITLELLDRLAGAEILTERFLTALRVPDELRCFGPDTRLELETVPAALRREIQHIGPGELRIHLGGSADQWEPLAWLHRHDLRRWSAADERIALVMPAGLRGGLSATQLDELAAAAYLDCRVYESATDARADGNGAC